MGTPWPGQDGVNHPVRTGWGTPLGQDRMGSPRLGQVLDGIASCGFLSCDWCIFVFSWENSRKKSQFGRFLRKLGKLSYFGIELFNCIFARNFTVQQILALEFISLFLQENHCWFQKIPNIFVTPEILRSSLFSSAGWQYHSFY